MIKTMRQNTKVILWIVAVAFVGLIVFSWGMDISGIRSGRGGVIGQVNGQRISVEQFRRALRQSYLQAKKQSDKEPDMDRLVEQTWQNLVGQILIAQEIEGRNIIVSEREVLRYIRENPPEIVRNQEAFKTDGEFDPAKYEKFLDDPLTYQDETNRRFIAYLEEVARGALRIQRLQDQLFGAIRVTSAEVRKDFTDRNEKVRVEYVFAGPETFRDVEVEVDEKEIQAYYDQHLEDFREAEKRRCDYVVLKKEPSPSDEERVKQEINDLLSEARGGADFSELARQNSDDRASASQGGDLGWFGHGHMVEPFEKVAFSLKVGEISDPVRTPFGWHIIKLTDRKWENGEEKIRASHILLEVKPGLRTLRHLREDAETLASEAKERDLKEVAGRLGYEVKDTGFFARGGYIPGIGRAAPLIRFAFTAKLGDVSDVYENERGFFVLQLKERKEEGIRPFEAVKAQIERKIADGKRRDIARKRIEGVMELIAGGSTLQDAVKAEAERSSAKPLEVESPEPFSRTDYVRGVSDQTEFTQVSFNLHVGQTSGIVSAGRGYYIIHLLEKLPIDEKEFQQKAEEIRQRLLSQKRYEAYNAWFTSLRNNAKIVDNRHLYYNLEAVE